MRGLWLAAVAMVVAPVMVLVTTVTMIAGNDEPGAGTAVVCDPGAGPDGSVAGFSGQQLGYAAEIVAVGREMGLPPAAWVIAVATAITESTLRNVPHGDEADPSSRGLFQQTKSWGPEPVRMDPKGSARLFYERLVALKNPTWDADPTLKGRDENPAQRVQISAKPLRYGEYEDAARQVVGHVAHLPCAAPAPSGVNPHAEVVIARAMSQLGVPYAWAGGTATGPSPGSEPDVGVVGFDCSGLALYAYAGAGIAVPHQTRQIWQRFGPAITDPTQVAPGDLVLLSNNRQESGIHHVGIYLGDGRVIEAPQSGETVKIREDIWRPGSYYQREFIGAVRPR